MASVGDARRGWGSALGLAPWSHSLSLGPSGATCEVVLAPCAPGPCRNGGECRESEDFESFSCVCPVGWQGETACSLHPWLGLSPGRVERPRGAQGPPGQEVVSSPSLGMCKQAAEPLARGLKKQELTSQGPSHAGFLDPAWPRIAGHQVGSISFPGRPQRIITGLRGPCFWGDRAEAWTGALH